MEVKLDAPANTLVPKLVTVLGIMKEVKLDAPKNALFPIVANVELGSKVTDNNLLALWNACTPISVTLLGIVMEVKLLAFWNAETPILVTFDPKVTSFKLIKLTSVLS